MPTSELKIIKNNKKFYDYLVRDGELEAKKFLFDNKKYAQFLFSLKNREEKQNIFIMKCCKLLSNFDNYFWLEESKVAFEKLILLIKNEKLKIEDSYYFLSDEKLLDGFSKSLNEYILSRADLEEKEKKRLEKLAREKKIDELISILIKELLSNEKTNETYINY